MSRTAVIAIGGNSLITDKEHQTVPDQFRACAETCRHVAALFSEPGLRVVVTHGNGPQVGFILRRSELSAGELHPVPLDSCVADTQGALGYQIQLALGNEFKARGITKQVVSLVTLCLVDRDDPAFRKPNKPIGPFLTREQAEDHRSKDAWDVVEDAGRGWRRVVASPRPKAIVEMNAVKSLLDSGFVVVAGGGGGIAVVADERGALKGALAVIDKDFASSLLARQIDAELFVISTGVERVCLRYGTPRQQAIDTMTLGEAKQYCADGHFQPGSMLPKIQAVIEFLEGGGREAIITDPDHLGLAIAGRAGTHIVP